MDVEYLRSDAEPTGHFSGFGSAAFGEWPTSHLPVSDIAIGHGNQFDVMTE